MESHNFEKWNTSCVVSCPVPVSLWWRGQFLLPTTFNEAVPLTHDQPHALNRHHHSHSCRSQGRLNSPRRLCSPPPRLLRF